MNWEAANRRRRSGLSIKDESERLGRDEAAWWLDRKAKGGSHKEPPSKQTTYRPAKGTADCPYMPIERRFAKPRHAGSERANEAPPAAETAGNKNAGQRCSHCAPGLQTGQPPGRLKDMTR
jgi:hypothetical protein